MSKINNLLDSYNLSKKEAKEASARVDKRLQKLTGGGTPILDIYNQARADQLQYLKDKLK